MFCFSLTIFLQLIASSLTEKEEIIVTKSIKGHCLYHEKLLEKNETVFDDEKCLSITCNVVEDAGFLIMLSCDPSPDEEDCNIYKGKGSYPKCCPVVVCP